MEGNARLGASQTLVDNLNRPTNPSSMSHLHMVSDEDFQNSRQFSSASTKRSHSSSQAEGLEQENLRLRQQLEGFRNERDDALEARESMLTELMEAQETAEDLRTVLAQKTAELSSLRQQLAEQSHVLQTSFSETTVQGEALSRNDERELRDLRLRCNRLQLESERKDKMLDQARADMLQANTTTSSANIESTDAVERLQQRLADSEDRILQVNRLYQEASRDANTYLQQIMDWKKAYDALQADRDQLHGSHLQLQQTHAQLSQAAKDSQTQSDSQLARELQSLNSELNTARQMVAFFKENSEKLSQKNGEVTERVRHLQDELMSKNREVGAQRSGMEPVYSR
jgi:chromosome segregation ATPase